MRYSTGRDSRLKHAAGKELESLRREKRKGTIPYSTGEDSHVKHATGMDWKKEEVTPCPLCHGRGLGAYGERCTMCRGKGLLPSAER